MAIPKKFTGETADMIITDEFADIDIEDPFEGKSAEDIVAEEVAVEKSKKEAKALAARLKKATDEECEDAVRGMLAVYEGIVREHTHWSLTLIEILNKIKYEPVRSMLANQKKLPEDISKLGYLQLTQWHLNIETLNHIYQEIGGWIAENDDWRVADEPEETPSLSYVAPTSYPVDESMVSSSEPSWGSW